MHARGLLLLTVSLTAIAFGSTGCRPAGPHTTVPCDAASKRIGFRGRSAWPDFRLPGLVYNCGRQTGCDETHRRRRWFSTDASLRGAPQGHTVIIREVRLSAGAEFVVMICDDIMTMPGLPKAPCAARIDVDDQGRITGLA